MRAQPNWSEVIQLDLVLAPILHSVVVTQHSPTWTRRHVQLICGPTLLGLQNVTVSKPLKEAHSTTLVPGVWSNPVTWMPVLLMFNLVCLHAIVSQHELPQFKQILVEMDPDHFQLRCFQPPRGRGVRERWPTASPVRHASGDVWQRPEEAPVPGQRGDDPGTGAQAICSENPSGASFITRHLPPLSQLDLVSRYVTTSFFFLPTCLFYLLHFWVSLVPEQKQVGSLQGA